GLKRKSMARPGAWGSAPDPEARFARCPQTPDGLGSEAPVAWDVASSRARERARRAGPRQPQVQWALQKEPVSLVLVECAAERGAAAVSDT
ncbi:hypothetical protein, partial [Streptomyces sp. NPDC001719]